MTRSRSRHWSRPHRLALASGLLAVVTAIVPSGASAAGGDAADAVIAWNAHAVAALTNPATATPPGAGQAPTVAAVHLAMVQLAVYDAVNSIGGSREAYLDNVPAAPGSASKAAAAATATHHVLVGLVNGTTPVLSQAVRDSLDATYDAFIAGLPTAGRSAGVTAGAAVAQLMLSARANDGRYGSFRFRTGTGVGEWRPVLPGFVNDPNAWVARTTPFSLPSTSRLRTEGPLDISSAEYAAEVNEVQELGAATGSSRSPEQEALARWVVASPPIMFNAGFRAIAQDRNLSGPQAARLFAMTTAASADAIISCLDDKEFWSFWRPITAIREAATDGNPGTTADPEWLPMFATPPYSDHPSGYNCYTGGAMHAAKAFFGTDKVSFSLTSHASGTTRDYDRFTDVVRDTIEGRILTGFHFRTADVQGAWIGKKAAQWVAKHEFDLAD
jgi:hypothetical protein